MSEIVFDATDPDVTSARQTEELRLMEQGSQLIEKQEAEAEDKYRRSELEAQEHSQYAGKFKSAEDLEKAYLELQKKLGQKETDESSSTDETESDESEDTTPDESESPVAKRVSFLKEASDEYYSNDNQLKPETIEKLKEMPSEELIEAYLELQKNNPVAQSQPLSTDAAKTIVDSVGGQDAYNDTLVWLPITTNLRKLLPTITLSIAVTRMLSSSLFKPSINAIGIPLDLKVNRSPAKHQRVVSKDSALTLN